MVGQVELAQLASRQRTWLALVIWPPHLWLPPVPPWMGPPPPPPTGVPEKTLQERALDVEERKLKEAKEKEEREMKEAKEAKEEEEKKMKEAKEEEERKKKEAEEEEEQRKKEAEDLIDGMVSGEIMKRKDANTKWRKEQQAAKKQAVSGQASKRSASSWRRLDERDIEKVPELKKKIKD